MRLDTFIEGVPSARGRGRPGEREAAWRRAIAQGLSSVPPLAGPTDYEVEAVFILARDRAEEMNPDGLHGADLDNLAKVLLDGLKPRLPGGDGAVRLLHLTKRRADDGERPGVHVRIR